MLVIIAQMARDVPSAVHIEDESTHGAQPLERIA
jgi:hypothetical protein